MRTLIYSCITNNYDSLREPIVPQSADMIMFSDKSYRSQSWAVSVIKPGRHADRFVKHNVMKLTNAYELYIWIDASFLICEDVAARYTEWIGDNDILFMGHPQRDDWKKEADVCLKYRKITKAKYTKQVSYYNKIGLPRHAGLVAGGIMVFRNNYRVKRFYLHWWEQQVLFSHRDQISWLYAIEANPKLKYTIRGWHEMHKGVKGHRHNR